MLIMLSVMIIIHYFTYWVCLTVTALINFGSVYFFRESFMFDDDKKVISFW